MIKFFNKITALICLFALISFVMACASAGSSNLNTVSTPANSVNPDDRLSIFDGDVSFIPPSGFKLLTKDQLKRDLPDKANLVLIIANADQTGSITVGYDDGMNFQPEQLAEIKKLTEGTFRASKAEWITSEIVEINGKQWFHFEWEKADTDDLSKLVAPELSEGEKTLKTRDEAPIRFHEYSTIFKGKLLGFAFDAHVNQYTQLKDGYIKSINTIQIKD
jgi:hypothetical protein